MSYKYKGRLCHERSTKSNNAWKLEELLSMDEIKEMVKNNKKLKTKTAICDELQKSKSKSKEKSREKSKEKKSSKKKKDVNCNVKESCPRGYKKAELIDMAKGCGVDYKDDKGKDSTMKVICERIKHHKSDNDQGEDKKESKKKKKPIIIEEKEDERSEDERSEDERIDDKCVVKETCPRGYKKSELVQLAKDCGVDHKDSKGGDAVMKVLCDRIKKSRSESPQDTGAFKKDIS